MGNKKPDNGIPRRIQIDLAEPAELAIFNAINEVENLGCDTRLTAAIELLNDAKSLVSDVIDERS